jgi:PilX N-terminal
MKTVVANRHRQSGATLVVALIILIVLMILGVGAVMTANSQFKMAGNLQFENQAKNNAENQLVLAEIILFNSGANSVYVKGQPVTVSTGKDSYTIELLEGGITPPGYDTSVDPNAPAKKVKANLFQITGHGESARGAARDVAAIYQVIF